MIDNVVQVGNIMYVFESFGELHFRPTFDAGQVRHCIAITDCLAIGSCKKYFACSQWRV